MSQPADDPVVAERTPVGVSACTHPSQGVECIVVCNDGSVWGLVPGNLKTDEFSALYREPAMWVEMAPVPGSRREQTRGTK